MYVITHWVKLKTGPRGHLPWVRESQNGWTEPPAAEKLTTSSRGNRVVKVFVDGLTLTILPSVSLGLLHRGSSGGGYGSFVSVPLTFP